MVFLHFVLLMWLLAVDWEDRNADESCTCESSWNWDGLTLSHGIQNNYNTDYLICEEQMPEYFQFHFVDMWSPTNFSLMLSHKFEDSL